MPSIKVKEESVSESHSKGQDNVAVTSTKSPAREWLVETLKSFIFAVAVCSVIYIFIAMPNQVEGLSMYPTFDNGQLVLTNKINQWLGGTDFGKSLGLDYQRGDVVVIEKPTMPEPLIKRIVGLPGERIAVKDGKVYINDEALTENYLESGVITTGASFIPENGIPKTIPEDQYAVMGDNREHSLDSRYVEVGFVSRSWLGGRVMFRYWPFSSAGVIPTGSSSLSTD